MVGIGATRIRSWNRGASSCASAALALPPTSKKDSAERSERESFVRYTGQTYNHFSPAPLQRVLPSPVSTTAAFFVLLTFPPARLLSADKQFRSTTFSQEVGNLFLFPLSPSSGRRRQSFSITTLPQKCLQTTTITRTVAILPINREVTLLNKEAIHLSSQVIHLKSKKATIPLTSKVVITHKLNKLAMDSSSTQATALQLLKDSTADTVLR